jgi:ribonuclease P protein component
VNKFPKQEKLCGRLRLQALYKEGRKAVFWPLRVTWRKDVPASRTAVVVWAPKSLFRHAVDRNLLRRRMREAYRLNKDNVEERGWQIAFHYMDKSIQPYHVIERAMQKALRKITEES